jgi:hypothetical protein
MFGRRRARISRRRWPVPEPIKQQPTAEEDEVDESSEESFPASDPPSWTMGRTSSPKLPSGVTPESPNAAPEPGR